MVKIAQDKKVAKLQNIKAESQVDLENYKELQQARYQEALAFKKKDIEKQLSSQGKDKDDAAIMAQIEKDYVTNE